MPGDSVDTKTVCFDLDGTLCTNTYGAYEEAEPFPWAIERLNALADAGHRIIVFTARGTATGIDWTDTTRAQLSRWGVRYDALRLGKPSADVYVDDRAVHTSAWREGDAVAVPGFGLPAAAATADVEQLPGVMAPQRSAMVETGRTYAGSPFLAEGHVERALGAAAAAGLAGLPTAAEVMDAVERALAAAAPAGGDLVFSIMLSDATSAAFLDVRDERSGRALVTVRRLEQVVLGLGPLLLEPGSGGIAVGLPEPGLGGRLAAAIDGRLALAPLPDRPPPLSTVVEGLAADAGVELAATALAPDQLDDADEVFEAVTPFGLLRVGEIAGRRLPAQDAVRGQLAAALSERVGLDVDVQLDEALRAAELPAAPR